MTVVTYPLLSGCNSDWLRHIGLDRWRKRGMHWDVRRFVLLAWSLGSLQLRFRGLDSSLFGNRLEFHFHWRNSSFRGLTFCRVYVEFEGCIRELWWVFANGVFKRHKLELVLEGFKSATQDTWINFHCIDVTMIVGFLFGTILLLQLSG